MNKPGILLEVVQILTDLDLTISKAYISSDGGWIMDVFHVTDQQGNKITDRKTIEYIEKALGPKRKVVDGSAILAGRILGVHSVGDHMAIELVGRDRPGLLSEIFAVLADLHFNVVAAEIWTHNRRTASVVYVNSDTRNALHEPKRLSTMEEQLKNILGECNSSTNGDGAAKTDPLPSRISIEHCREKGYSVVTVQTKDRPKLMFDFVCTLTDMHYVVFHALASQDYYIRGMDGCTLDTEVEKERVIKCLEAAMKLRVSKGVSLELCAKDRVGLLSEETRVLHEQGLSVARARVSTVGEQAMNTFYVMDSCGNPVDSKTDEALRTEIGQTMMLSIKKTPLVGRKDPPFDSGWAKTSFFFEGLFGKYLA